MSIAEQPKNETDNPLKIVEDATCTFCGCVCDDINLTVEGNQDHQSPKCMRVGQSLVL
jgi:formylmethanofuran dehydrogenase subunit B